MVAAARSSHHELSLERFHRCWRVALRKVSVPKLPFLHETPSTKCWVVMIMWRIVHGASAVQSRAQALPPSNDVQATAAQP